MNVLEVVGCVVYFSDYSSAGHIYVTVRGNHLGIYKLHLLVGLDSRLDLSRPRARQRFNTET